MRLRTPRMFVAAGIAGVAMLGTPALAQESAELTADEQAWATSTQLAGLGDPVATTTLGQGDLPVGANGTEETKRSYLLLDVPETAISALLVLPVSEGAEKNFGVAGPLLACPVVEELVMQSGDAISESPAVDCGEEPVVGEVDDEGVYTWVLDAILARWAAGETNNGIALVADVSTPQANYQITFDAPFFEPIGTYTLPEEDGADEDRSDPGFVAPPVSNGSGSTGSGSGSSFSPPPSFGSTSSFESFTSSPAVEEAVEQPAPAVAPPAETPAAEPTAVAPPSHVVAAGPFEPMPVNPVAWLLIPIAIAVLFVAGRGLTGVGEPTSSLDRLLAA